MPNIHCYETLAELMPACADAVCTALAAAIETRGVARIALSGGSTPAALYDELVNHPQALDWTRVEFYFGDERSVPQDHPDSNFRLAQQRLFTPLGIDTARTFPLISAPPCALHEEADRYTALLQHWAGIEIPKFDLVLNGMGDDGHFASLFPHSPALNERQRWVVVNPVERLKTERITLTYPVFEAARQVFFLVAGAAKHSAFTAIKRHDCSLPAAQLVRARPTEWFIDRACAEGVS